MFLVVLFCVLIAAGGIAESELRHKASGWQARVGATAVAGAVVLGIIGVMMYQSTLVKRIRFDERGMIYTRGRKLMAKIPWKDVESVSTFERQGGFTMGKAIRVVEIKAAGQKPFRIESDPWGQDSLDRTVQTVRHYNKAHDFDAAVEKWESTDKFMFSSGGGK